jgi:hypothetical protein
VEEIKKKGSNPECPHVENTEEILISKNVVIYNS